MISRETKRELPKEKEASES